jgi:hypothetical protein
MLRSHRGGVEVHLNFLLISVLDKGGSSTTGPDRSWQRTQVPIVQEAVWTNGGYGREWRGENLLLPRGSNIQLSSP